MAKSSAAEQPDLLLKDVTPPKPAVNTASLKKAKIKDGIQAKKDLAASKARAAESTAVAVAQPQAPKNVLAIIADAASNPNVNPENMRALLDMQKEIMAEQSRRDFNAAFIALQADLSKLSIRKDGKIVVPAKDGKTGYATPYATFNGIMAIVQPLLTKHGFALSFQTEPGAAPDRILVRGFLDGHGHQRSTAFPLPLDSSGGKNNVQGWGSAMAYGKRYCTIALLNIISADPQDRDTDGTPNAKPAKGGGFVDAPPPPPTISEDQAVALRESIEWCGVGMAKFLDHYGIKKVLELPANMFDAATKACKDFHANQNRKK